MNRFCLEVSRETLDLPLTVTCGQVFRWEQVEGGRWLGVDGAHWWLVDPLHKSLEVDGSGSNDEFRRLFRLGEDIDDILRRIRAAAPELAPELARLPGLRLMRPSDVVEETFCFLCTPNNNLRRITSMVQKLAEYGQPIAQVCGREVRRFPALETIASIEESELRTKGFGYRARTITEIARQVLSLGGRRWLERIAAAPYPTAFESLLTLRGVGPKLADCICLFALHHTEAVPVDTHMWQAATRLYFPEWRGKPLTDFRYRAVGELMRSRFGPLAGYAHQFMFFGNLSSRRET